MLLNDGVPCFFCMGVSAARLGLDKKGRPYVHCVCCGARSFLPSFTPCLNGVAVLGPLAHAIHDEMARDREAWERRHKQISMFIAALRARLNGGAAPTETLATNAGGEADLPTAKIA